MLPDKIGINDYSIPHPTIPMPPLNYEFEQQLSEERLRAWVETINKKRTDFFSFVLSRSPVRS
jgi:hypothetical protein